MSSKLVISQEVQAAAGADFEGFRVSAPPAVTPPQGNAKLTTRPQRVGSPQRRGASAVKRVRKWEECQSECSSSCCVAELFPCVSMYDLDQKTGVSSIYALIVFIFWVISNSSFTSASSDGFYVSAQFFQCEVSASVFHIGKVIAYFLWKQETESALKIKSNGAVGFIWFVFCCHGCAISAMERTIDAIDNPSAPLLGQPVAATYDATTVGVKKTRT